MKRLLFAILLLASASQAAIDAGTVWEIRTTGAQTNGGGFRWVSLVNATYKWTASTSGTNECYCEAAAGGNPSLTQPTSVTTDGKYNLAASGTLGSLTADQWAWGDNDSLGYSTLYVRLANGLDPDAMLGRGQPGYVSMGFGGGTDYSQQDAPQLSLADIATDGAGTGLSSVTGGFTAAMVGNCIYLTGGTATAGWYQITAYASTNAVTIDRSAGASKTGVTGNVGGAFLIGGTFDDDFFEARTAGNHLWIKTGTYTTGEAINSAVAGSIAASAGQIRHIGYKTARGDFPLGDDRPLLTDGAASYSLLLTGRDQCLLHLRVLFTSNSTNSVQLGTNATVINCQVGNDSTAANRTALYVDDFSKVIGCEATCAGSGSSVAINTADSCLVLACYAKDSVTGFNLGGNYNGGTAVQCIASTCTTGFMLAQEGTSVVNCTAYNSATGFSISNSSTAAINSIASGGTTGVSFAGTPNGVVLYGALNCTNNVSGVAAGAISCLHATNIFGDPGLKDPANGDFSVDSSDTNVYQQGVDVGTFTSAITYKE